MTKQFLLSMSTFLLFLAIHPRCIAQILNESSFKIIPEAFGSDYTVIALVDEETLSQPNLLFSVEQLMSHNASTYLFLNTLPLDDIYDQLNKSIRSSSGNLNKKSLHLIIKGSGKVLDTYKNLDTDYFNTCYYISTDQRMTNANEAYVTTHEIEWRSEEYLQSIQGKYFWDIDMAGKKKPTRALKKHEEGRFTLGYKPAVNFGLKDNELGEYFTNGLNLDYAITRNLQIYAGLIFSLKRPYPQSEVRTQILNQINVSEILSGDFQSDEEVSLSIPIEGQVYAEALVGIKYLMRPNRSVSPYFSSEISRNYSSKISGRIDTTLILDLSNGFDGSLSEDLNPDNLESLGIQVRKANNTNIGIGTGIQCKLSGHLRFDLGVSYSTSIRNRSPTSNFNNNAIRLNLGLNYRFKDKKEYDVLHFY